MAFIPVFLGLVASLYASAHIVRAILARRWPCVEGEIAEIGVVRGIENDESEDYEYVVYRYQVNGQPYRNDRVRFGPVVAPAPDVPGLDPRPLSPSGAALLAERFPTHSPVPVFYNPKDPADSVLHRAPSLAVWACLFLGQVFFWVGLRTLFLSRV